MGLWSADLKDDFSYLISFNRTGSPSSKYNHHHCCVRGTQREILRERPKSNNKAWIKLFEAILSILGDCWEKFICSSLPARLMEDDAILDIKSIPSDTLNWLFPSNTFPPRTYYFSQISQPAKICLNNRYFEEQIHWVPLLRNLQNRTICKDKKGNCFSLCKLRMWKDLNKNWLISLKLCVSSFLFYLFYLASPITEKMNNKFLIRQGCHNSVEPITVVPELKRYVSKKQ